PHQVLAELKKATIDTAPTSKRSLVYHSLITLGATLSGFLAGAALGILLAIGIVHSRALDLGVMPWAIISQAIPIVARAPMIAALSNAVGIERRLVTKPVSSACLSFFPVLGSMPKGLRSPDAIQLDLVRTHSASRAQVFWKLRLPS